MTWKLIAQLQQPDGDGYYREPHPLELIETGKTDNELLEPAFIRRKTTV